MRYETAQKLGPFLTACVLQEVQFGAAVAGTKAAAKFAALPFKRRFAIRMHRAKKNLGKVGRHVGTGVALGGAVGGGTALATGRDPVSGAIGGATTGAFTGGRIKANPSGAAFTGGFGVLSGATAPKRRRRFAEALSEETGKKRQSFVQRHPILTGAGVAGAATVPTSLVGAAVFKNLMGKVETGGSVSKSAKVFKAARQLFPQVNKLARARGGRGLDRGKTELSKQVSAARGSAFTDPVAANVGRFASLKQAIFKRIDPDAAKKAARLTSKPSIVTQKTPHPSVLAHELGHASVNLGRGGKVSSVSRAVGQRIQGTRAFLGSAVAQHGISKSKAEGKTRRNLHLAAGAIPAVAAAPVIADEVRATARGLKIQRAAGVKGGKGALAAALGTYLLANAPGIIGAGTTAGILANRSAKKNEKRRP